MGILTVSFPNESAAKVRKHWPWTISDDKKLAIHDIITSSHLALTNESLKSGSFVNASLIALAPLQDANSHYLLLGEVTRTKYIALH